MSVGYMVGYLSLFLTGPTKMAMHTVFGDGLEIPMADVTHVRDTIHTKKETF